MYSMSKRLRQTFGRYKYNKPSALAYQAGLLPSPATKLQMVGPMRQPYITLLNNHGALRLRIESVYEIDYGAVACLLP
jgi:hypothetical protein